jgi:hypothetical protein
MKTMKIIVKIFDSNTTSQHCKDIYERICQSKMMENYGPDKEIYITNDDDEYTHALLLNRAMPVLRGDVEKSNVIGMALDPSEYHQLNDDFIRYTQLYTSKYYIGCIMNLPEPFIEGKVYPWHMTPLTYIPKYKSNLVSIVVCQNNQTRGHQYRHSLVEKILDSPLPIDVYGSGCSYYMNRSDDRLKGVFNSLEPYEEYHFNIVVENIIFPRHYSEKLINPLLCATTPIYLGCSSIDEYFPNMVISLTGDIRKDMELLYNIIVSPEEYRKPPNIGEVKRTVNLLHHLPSLFYNS